MDRDFNDMAYLDSGVAGTVAQRPVKLFCIPHAGGGASAYRGWADALAPHVAVQILQLRGRESRFREPPQTELEDVLADLLDVVAPEARHPFALFGHSMGGLLAFELAHRLRRLTGRTPVHLFVSACRAPNRAQIAEPISTLPQPDFVAEVMRRYGGIPAAILADKGFMAAILPAMRADFGILERYQVAERSPLDCPVSVFGGLHDKATPRPALEDWRQHTTGGCSLQMLEGEHFYLQQQRPVLAAKIVSSVSTNR
ncbi:MAG TPA: alpha/beta fold hydrolase [Rhodopila sp.]|uniref:thioesterase II family protein n=1 Tax=Rhodopila sp. TaxID=2480087 RepID=UPI002BC26AC3|nr:alpha/beta fold hydrolase [Rhodopila sp.]HVY14527.1 alpha/beta fold hydrolase [Rhodopila sp.]